MRASAANLLIWALQDSRLVWGRRGPGNTPCVIIISSDGVRQRARWVRHGARHTDTLGQAVGGDVAPRNERQRLVYIHGDHAARRSVRQCHARTKQSHT